MDIIHKRYLKPNNCKIIKFYKGENYNKRNYDITLLDKKIKKLLLL